MTEFSEQASAKVQIYVCVELKCPSNAQSVQPRS